MQKTFELSSKRYKNGRRKFTAALYKLQPPESVRDGVGTKYNKNGITFLEKYAEKELDSICGMSVTVSFLDDERTQIYDHGFTEINSEDGLPTFNNATMVGSFSKGYIDTIDIDGVPTRCVCGVGTLDEMRYHNFVEKLENDLANGFTVEGSIEIYRDENHDTIVYENNYTGDGRIPTHYVHSGWSFVLNPADTTSTLLELNQKKEEEINMDEKALQTLIRDTILEVNSKNDELNEKITELNSQLEEKNNEISELNVTLEQVQKALDDLKKEKEGFEAEKEALERELGEIKAKERLGELNNAIENFTETERKYAEVEINSFKEDPMNGDLDLILSKIYAGIGRVIKTEEKVAEHNSLNEPISVDIFSEIMDTEPVDNPEDINIF